MKLTQELKDKIKKESESYLKTINETSQYGSLTDKQRDELGAFFTPPELCIQMLEMFNFDTIEDFAKEDILDPTCGSGNLIMAALIVGSSVNSKYPEKVFGNELSETTLNIARKRFVEYCEKNGLKQYDADFWKWHLHQGNALDVGCIDIKNFLDPKKGKKYTFENSKVKIINSETGKAIFSLNKRK